MSEYQYYEFLAVDRPLTAKQMDEVRGFSTRADITPTSFVNEYHWGSFKGDPERFLERYFDVMLYYANWGTHTLMAGLPADAIAEEVLGPYCVGDSVWFKRRGEKVIVGFESQLEEAPEYDELEGPLMATLAPVREELLRGDYRALYLGWLLAAQSGELGEDDPEPPVPAGLGSLSAPQVALADFLRIDEHLLEVAVGASAPAEAAPDPVPEMVRRLSAAEREDLLVQFLRGDDPYLATRVRRRLTDRPAGPAGIQTGRTVGQLMEAAERHREVAEEEERRRRARAKAKRDAEAARKRAADLDALAARGEAAWREVDAMIGRKTPKAYDEAVGLLVDLHDLAARDAREEAFTSRVMEIASRYGKRPALIERLRKKGWI